jgi:RHS repeat-associated protein
MLVDTDNNGSPEIIEESHYYAFGMRIEGLSTSNPDNKFTYNRKELTEDHGLNWYEFGWRMYDAQIGRWHQVDPKDEFLSPYVYVGNKPLVFIDPDGQDTWFIHGTGVSKDVWGKDATGNWAAVFGETVDQTKKFDWSAPSFFKSNQSFTRQAAAIKLAHELIAYKKDNPDAPINIVAHSHGGNVAMIAANIVKEQGYKVDNLIIIGTPENGTELVEGATDMFVSVYSEDDMVQVSGGRAYNLPGVGEFGPAGRKHDGAFNLNVTDVEGVSGGPRDSHGNMDQNPWVVNVISKFLNVLWGNE